MSTTLVRWACATCSSTTPWRPTYLAVYCAFVGIAAESVIIDSDHWRHYFLLLGVIWGLMAVSRPYRRGALPARAWLAALHRRSGRRSYRLGGA